MKLLLVCRAISTCQDLKMILLDKEKPSSNQHFDKVRKFLQNIFHITNLYKYMNVVLLSFGVFICGSSGKFCGKNSGDTSIIGGYISFENCCRILIIAISYWLHKFHCIGLTTFLPSNNLNKKYQIYITAIFY